MRRRFLHGLNGLERDLADFGDDVSGYGFVPADDDTIMKQSVQWGANILQTDTSFGASMSKIWEKAEQEAAEAVAISESIIVTTGIVIGALNTLGFAALGTILSTLLSAIISEIMTALTLGAVTTVAGAAAIGSAGGYIGTIIGAIIGAIIAGITLITGGPKVQITNGNWFSAQDYAKTNVPNAANWLKSATTDQLMGLTPLQFANQANLFLANPVWMYLNQDLIGIPQPPPPEYGTGSVLDVVYGQLPGAFELLNRVQLLAATSIVNTNPSRLSFFRSIHVKPKQSRPSGLASGESVIVNQTIKNGALTGVLQSDGNFVIYDGGGKAIWATGTTSGTMLIMQKDGNLVLLSGNTPIWSSNTAGHAGAYVTLQGDGNFVVYSAPGNKNPVWASGSSSSITTQPSGVYPDQNPMDYQPAVYRYPDSSGGGFGVSTWAPGSPDPSFTANWSQWNKRAQAIGLNINVKGPAFSLYTACPHLATNLSLLDPNGKVVDQTDICDGIYALQVMFPSLTHAQCDAIFAAATPQYNQIYNAAHTWAMSQSVQPTTATLGAGGKYNLTSPDVATIIADWRYAHQVHGATLPAIRKPPKAQPVSSVISNIAKTAPPKRKLTRANIGILAAIAAAASIGGYVAIHRRR